MTTEFITQSFGVGVGLLAHSTVDSNRWFWWDLVWKSNYVILTNLLIRCSSKHILGTGPLLHFGVDFAVVLSGRVKALVHQTTLFIS